MPRAQREGVGAIDKASQRLVIRALPVLLLKRWYPAHCGTKYHYMNLTTSVDDTARVPRSLDYVDATIVRGATYC